MRTIWQIPTVTRRALSRRRRASHPLCASNREPLGELVFGHSYLTRRDAVELDPVQLRLTRRVRRTDGMFGALRDTMAISWGLRGTMDGPPDTGGALAFDSVPVPPAPKQPLQHHRRPGHTRNDRRRSPHTLGREVLWDLRELFARICFNAAISNLGDDLRRPMMIAQGKGWRPCPWSSAAPTPWGEREHGDPGMIYSPNGRSPTREIVAGARRFLLDKEAAEAIFDMIFEIVQSSCNDVLRRSGVSVQDCELVGRSIDSLRPPPTG